MQVRWEDALTKADTEKDKIKAEVKANTGSTGSTTPDDYPSDPARPLEHVRQLHRGVGRRLGHHGGYGTPRR